MIHLRLTHGAGHSNGFVSVTKERPDAYVEDEAVAAFCVDSGFFEIVHDVSEKEQEPDKKTGSDDFVNVGTEQNDDKSDESDDLKKMTVEELRAYAETTGVDLTGVTKKADIITTIKAAEDAVDE